MLTLLSPAKSLDFSASENGLPVTLPRFEKDTAVLMKRCKKLGVRSLRNLMGISPSLAELNRERFQAMSLPFTKENAKACVLAFKGDVYKGLEAASMTDEDLVFAQDHLRILSGLYGLLRPLDLIQPYRLEMGSRLSNTRGKNLYSFWGSRLVDSLNSEHAERPVPAVLNLASVEYMKAVPTKQLVPPLVTASFKEIRDGEPRVISFLAKRARGLMARFIVRNRIESPEGLLDFKAEGYGYRADLSRPELLVFAR